MKRIEIKVNTEENNEKIEYYVKEWIKLNFQDSESAELIVEDI